MSSNSTRDSDPAGALSAAVDRLLVRDRDAHADAIATLAERGDERVVPHLVELVVIDSIANGWDEFGFPEVLRDRSPPRYLELPEVRWPGVVDALGTIAEPDYDSSHAWVEWETWYSQQHIDPLEGFDEWKRRLYRSYLPPVGSLLDAEPREFDLQDVRWGNCDRSFLAALNAPDFVPGDAVGVDGETDDLEEASGLDETADAETDGRDHRRYLRPDDLVFGFEIDGTAYAVPRKVLFPHELLNVEIGGRAVSLTYCTLCNAPILYDRRVDGRTLTFGSSGMLLEGNKVMYDEETESLWSQHRGTPIAGEYLERGVRLDVLPVTQTEWRAWKTDNSDTYALDVETGYDYDYGFYDDEVGIFRHYWGNENVVQPGVEAADGPLSEKADVYGVTTGDDGDEVRIYPIDAVAERDVIVDEIDGERVVVLEDATGDVAVYYAPPFPVERRGNTVLDGEGTEWRIARNALVAEGDRRERIPGRHGLWFAFRVQYRDPTVVTGSD